MHISKQRKIRNFQKHFGVVIVAERALQAVVVFLVAQGITLVALAKSGEGVVGNWCRLHHKTRLTSAC